MTATTQKKAGYEQQGLRGTGRRKEAVARVRLKPGSGRFVVNGLEADQYFCGREILKAKILRPLQLLEVTEQYDIIARVHGGGKSGQADALQLGLARALVLINAEYEKTLRDEKLLTRNALVKERKKYGLKKARKAFQFSKR